MDGSVGGERLARTAHPLAAIVHGARLGDVAPWRGHWSRQERVRWSRSRSRRGSKRRRRDRARARRWSSGTAAHERTNEGQMNTRERNSEGPKDRNRRNALLFLALRTTTTTTIPTNHSIRSLSLARSLALSLCVPLILGDYLPRHLTISCNGSRVVSWCSWVRVLRRHRW